MAGLLELARKAASEANPLDDVEYGPWMGSMRSITAERVPREYATAGNDFLYLPREKAWRRRDGQTQVFDTFGAAVGMLPAKWSGKGRWLEEFKSGSISDGVPTVMALVTKETVASGLDDGRFSQVYVRDQVNDLNYTLGDEFGTDTYPDPGSVQTYRVLPLWYDSGDGGLTRGTSEFARRFFVSGSRRFLKVGGWHFHPSLYGTPSRWDGRFVPNSLASMGGASATLKPSGLVGGQNWDNQRSGAGGVDEGALTAAAVNVNDDNTLYAGVDDGTLGNNTQVFSMDGTITAGKTWAVHLRLRTLSSTAVSGTAEFHIIDANGDKFTYSGGVDLTGLSTTWTDYTFNLDCTGTPSGAGTANSIEIGLDTQTNLYTCCTYIQISTGTVDLEENAIHLLPSGPLPALHSGTLTKGSTISDDGTIPMRPDADITDGSWLNEAASGTNIYQSIDDVTTDTADYIRAAPDGAACEIGMSNPGYTPTLFDQVDVGVVWSSTKALASIAQLSVRILQGATQITQFIDFHFPLDGSNWRYKFYTLSPTEKASVTDWDDIRIEFTATTSVGTVTNVSVAQAYIAIRQSIVQSQGGWKGSDRFYHGVAFRNEDGAVWMPCLARPPSQLLLNGFNIFTVDPANPTATYDRIVYSNLPIGPPGTSSRLLLRSPKISAVQDDNLQLDPLDMRVIAEIKDNTTTTYEDYYGTDESLTLDTFKAFIRYDHIMPPRARYIFGGDMRVCHAYGGQNPAAIVIAPVGRTADYDLNLVETNSSLYDYDASYMSIQMAAAGTASLVLVQTDGATATNTKTFAFATYDTLQKLVDAINATNCTDDGQQWRAQLAPGANPDAGTLSLVPHNRAIASCVVDNTAKTITKAAGGLSKVAVGQLISGAAEETGAYVTEITSDTALKFSGTLTTTTETLYFYNDLGDTHVTDPDTTALGFQRVLGSCLPGFLYFSKSYLDDEPLDTQAVWMTVASPGQAKSAANNFSGKLANKFTPPSGDAGISMGGGPVDQGFVVPYANAIYAIRNVRDSGSGIDEDYRMVVINAVRGCCAWNTVVPGNRFVPYLTAHGVCAADLDGEVLLSEAIYLHAPDLRGDFDYEIPLCVAATAADDDTAYASARIMRGALWISYRNSGSHPDRQVVYDFSSGSAQSGLDALRDDQGRAWGWSLELVRSVTAMAEARRADGSHLYGWNDQNAGSTGDGRIDELETTDQDNTTDISADLQLPWLRAQSARQLSGQEIVLEHDSPAGSTGFLDFTRSYQGDLYSLTPGTSSLVVTRDVKLLPQAARVGSAACRVGYRQLTGGARTLRKVTLRVKQLNAYK